MFAWFNESLADLLCLLCLKPRFGLNPVKDVFVALRGRCYNRPALSGIGCITPFEPLLRRPTPLFFKLLEGL